MKIIPFLFLVFCFPAFALTAPQALKQVLTDFEYQGNDTRGERCFIDLFGRPNGDVMLELAALAHAKYLVTTDAAFELKNGVFTTKNIQATDDQRGFVEMSLEVAAKRIKIQRDFSVGERHWVSDLTCVIED